MVNNMYQMKTKSGKLEQNREEILMFYLSSGEVPRGRLFNGFSLP